MLAKAEKDSGKRLSSQVANKTQHINQRVGGKLACAELIASKHLNNKLLQRRPIPHINDRFIKRESFSLKMKDGSSYYQPPNPVALSKIASYSVLILPFFVVLISSLHS